MTDFTDGEISYSTIFEISTHKMIGNMFGFDAEEIDYDHYRSNKVYKTKNEAIDTLIAQLRILKDECIHDRRI